MAGPIKRVALNADEFSAMALARSSFPTISTKKDWRAGMSKAVAVPINVASTMMTPIVSRPE